jgi:penicillin-binding protein 1C
MPPARIMCNGNPPETDFPMPLTQHQPPATQHTARTRPALIRPAFIRAAAAVGISLFCTVMLLLVLDAAFPPDLSRYNRRSVLVTDAEGRLLHAFLSPDGMWRLHTTPHDVDSRYLDMLRTYEDKRFGMHPGVDPLAVLRAAAQLAVSGHVVSGASTLSMQAARLLQPRPRTLKAKLMEALRAMQLHWRYGSNGVLSIYLTLAPFGSNIEGVRAASLAYFGKEPRRLTTGEAALLVALPQSPTQLRPDRNPLEARKARDKILGRMHAAGIISGRQHTEARTESIPAVRRQMPALASVLALNMRNAAPRREHIATALSLPVQHAAETLCQRHALSMEQGAATAAVVLHRATRQVRAYVGGKNADASRNYLDLPRALRSPGSTLKPFIYGLAFSEHILHPETLISDEAHRFGDFSPRNFRRGYQGAVTVREALRDSLNVPAVSVLYALGPDRLVAALRNAGATLAVEGDATLPIALGGAGTTLLDLTTLYAALADGGTALPPQFVPAVLPAPQQGFRLMDSAAAWQVIDILKDSPRPQGYLSAAAGGRPVAFKTGTSYGYRDAWAVGASPDWVVGVWTGRPDGRPRPGAVGRTAAVPLLLDIFGRLPPDTGPWPSPPAGVLDVRDNRRLPTGLQRFVPGSGTGLPVLAGEPPRILHPQQGATVESLGQQAGEGIALRASGGTAPLRWVVNGLPLPEDQHYWLPDSEGFARLTLVDAAGRSATVQIRIILPQQPALAP